MNYRHTWGQLKGTVGVPIGLDAGHANLLPRVNEACEVLWNAGDWVGKFQRYKLKINGTPGRACFITWPRFVETIEAARLCDAPLGVRNAQFEFVEHATGDLDRAFSVLLGDRQEVCSFDDMDEDGRLHRIQVETHLSADNDGRVLLLGLDPNGHRVRTVQNGVMADGEVVVFNAAAAPLTVSNFAKLTGVQFLTNPRAGRVTLYQVNENGGEKPLAVYDPDEEVPVYRRSVLSGARGGGAQTLLVLARMRFQPVKRDTDYVQISSVTAIKNMLVALQKRDNGKLQEAAAYQQLAINALDDELKQYRGAGPGRVMRFADAGAPSGVNVM
ncbi:MAG: hypothetical protein LBK60_03360 [Verrucomicrobiales bacterium]|jgi:hypothetical protein|nr:hypothetical protein [Verrucomicrobiales bacterium]